MRAARAYISVICEFWHSTAWIEPLTLLHAHGSSRFWEQEVHPAPPAWAVSAFWFESAISDCALLR